MLIYSQDPFPESLTIRRAKLMEVCNRVPDSLKMAAVFHLEVRPSLTPGRPITTDVPDSKILTLSRSILSLEAIPAFPTHPRHDDSARLPVWNSRLISAILEEEKKSLFIRRLCRCRRATILCTDYLIRPDPKPKKRECNTKKKLSFLVKLSQKYDVLCPCVCCVFSLVCWCVCTPLGGVYFKSFGSPFCVCFNFPKFLVDIPPLSE